MAFSGGFSFSSSPSPSPSIFGSSSPSPSPSIFGYSSTSSLFGSSSAPSFPATSSSPFGSSPLPPFPAVASPFFCQPASPATTTTNCFAFPSTNLSSTTTTTTTNSHSTSSSSSSTNTTCPPRSTKVIPNAVAAEVVSDSGPPSDSISDSVSIPDHDSIIPQKLVSSSTLIASSDSTLSHDSPPDLDESSTPPTTDIHIPLPDKVSISDHDSISESTTIPVINLEVMVEKKKNRVVFAESDKEFVDLLFSFLTLPIGTIINLLKDKSPPTNIGCVNNLYKSVENLDARFLISEVCKDMLLHQRRPPEVQCRNLKVMVDGNSEPVKKCYYFCQNLNCRREGKGLITDFPNVRCHCGRVMNQLATLDGAFENEREGGYLKDGAYNFLISDDMQVMPGSTSQSIMLLEKLSIVDANELESQNVSIGAEEMLQLLQLSLLSKTPLTHFLKQGASELVELQPQDMAKSPAKQSLTGNSRKMDLKLFISKSRNKVLYAECGEDFVDFLFSFLTFPLGSILKLLGGKSSVECVDNLYRSVEDLSNDYYLKSKKPKNILLCPKLAPFFSCENQLLHIKEGHKNQFLLGSREESTTEWFVRPLTSEFNGFTFGEGLVRLSMVNPKSSTGETLSGGGFVRGPAKFMVTDALVVTLLSPISSITLIGKLNVPITDVDEKLVKLGEEEALNLLKAALISETALSDVFASTDQCLS